MAEGQPQGSGETPQDGISSEELEALLGGMSGDAPAPTPAAQEALSDEISADELAALGFSSPVVSAPAPQPTASVTAKPDVSPTAEQHLPELTAEDDVTADAGLSLLMDVPLTVSVELGRINMTLQQVLALGRGSIVELERVAGEPVDVLVNNKIIARGEVVVIDQYFGIKITELLEARG